MNDRILAAGFWLYLAGIAAFGAVFVGRLIEVLAS
jgi:hypothetical protein